MDRAAVDGVDDTALPEWIEPVTAEMLRATFGHWRIFEADGRWFALRSGTAFEPHGPLSLLHPALIAETLEGLASQLSTQAWLASLPADELRDVWLKFIGASPQQPEGPSAVRSQP